MAQTPQSNNSAAPRRGAIAYILNPPTSETDAPGRSPRAYQDTPPRTAAADPTGERGRDAPAARTQQNIERKGRPAPVELYNGSQRPSTQAYSSARSPSESPFILRRASFSSASSCDESDHVMSPGAPVPSSSISPPRTSAKKRANAKIHSFSTSAGLVKYIYVGKPANNGRNVLQRVEDLIADPYIKSFGPHDVVCAGCDYPFATSNGSANAGIYKYSTGGWRKHQCNRLLDWKDPFSPRKLTPEMAAEFAHSRMVSRDRALAHLVEVDQIERVYY